MAVVQRPPRVRAARACLAFVESAAMTLLPSILFRYIFRQAAGSVVMILASLTGVVWIALALRQLNLVTSQGQDTWLFIKMTLLALPNLMALIAPVALLVSTIQVLNRLNGD